MYTVYGRFEWDSEKAQRNVHKHGISFKTAAFAFDDPEAIILGDPLHSHSEIREWLIGETIAGILVAVFTVRFPEGVVRIISARRATQNERRIYAENKGV